MADNYNAPPSAVKPENVRRKASAGAGNTTAQLIRQSNTWRETYNPLRGLVLRRVVSMLEASEWGDYAELQWLYRMVEKRFPVLRSLVIRRRSALTKLDWDVKIVSELPEGSTDEQAKAQRDFLKSRYELIGNLQEAIRFLALAEFRGFSILNKWRFEGGPNDGAVKELHWLPQWNFARDGQFGDYYWNQNAMAGATAKTLGEVNRIDPEDFIIREVDMPINEIGVIAFVRSNLSLKDWDAFVEMFGIPGCVVVMPGNIPPGREEEFKEAARSVAEGASGALPSGADAKFPSSNARTGAPFKEHLEYQEKDVVLAGTGGKLTMLTGPVGLGGSQAEVHEDVFDEIATAEAGEISEIFQCQFDRLELAAQFPDQPVLAYFAIQPVDKTAEETRKFKRDTFKQWLADGTVSDVLANLTDLKQLTEDVDLPVNAEYIDPYLPVADKSGALVTGEVVKDAQGDVIGAKPEKAAAAPALALNRPNQPNQPGELKPAGEAGLIENRAADLPSASLESAGTELLARAVQQDLRPVLDRLQRLMAIQDPAILQGRLLQFVSDLDAMSQDVNADPAMANALQQILGAATARGLAVKNREAMILNGDTPGHAFHGNQWTEAVAAESSRLRSEAEAARQHAWKNQGTASDEDRAKMHQDAADKFKTAAQHARDHGARATARNLNQAAQSHQSEARWYGGGKKKAEAETQATP